MYQHSLLLEQLRVDREIDLRRRSQWSRRNRPVNPAGRRRRLGWWPHPQRGALRLAMSGVLPGGAASTRPCTDC